MAKKPPPDFPTGNTDSSKRGKGAAETYPMIGQHIPSKVRAQIEKEGGKSK